MNDAPFWTPKSYNFQICSLYFPNCFPSICLQQKSCHAQARGEFWAQMNVSCTWELDYVALIEKTTLHGTQKLWFATARGKFSGQSKLFSVSCVWQFHSPQENHPGHRYDWGQNSPLAGAKNGIPQSLVFHLAIPGPTLLLPAFRRDES